MSAHIAIVDRSPLLANGLIAALAGAGRSARRVPIEGVDARHHTSAIIEVATPNDVINASDLVNEGVSVVALVRSPCPVERTRRLLRAGVHHVIPDTVTTDVLVHSVIHETDDVVLMPRDAAISGLTGTPSDVLGEQEIHWLRALAKGQRVHELADDAGYSERSMFRQLSRLYDLLGAANRTEALVAAERLALLDG